MSAVVVEPRRPTFVPQSEPQDLAEDSHQRSSPPADPEQPQQQPMKDRPPLPMSGSGPGTEPGTAGGQCSCCPYGFHIDLDFVRYAENVSKGDGDDGREHARQVRKARKKKRKSMELLMGQPALLKKHDRMNNGGALEYNHRRSSPTGDDLPFPDRSGVFSPIESVFSDSLENAMSDFEEAYSTQSLSKHHHQQQHHRNVAANDSSQTLRAPPPPPQRSTVAAPQQQHNFRVAPPVVSGYTSDTSSFLGSSRSSRFAAAAPQPPSSHRRAPSGYTSDFSDGKRRQFGGYTSDTDFERSAFYDPSRSLSSSTMPRNGNAMQRPGQLSFGHKNNGYLSAPAMEPQDGQDYISNVERSENRERFSSAKYRGMSGQIAAQIDNLARSIRSPAAQPRYGAELPSPAYSQHSARSQPFRPGSVPNVLPARYADDDFADLTTSPGFGGLPSNMMPHVSRRTPTIGDPSCHRSLPRDPGSEIREMRRRQQEADDLERQKWESSVNQSAGERGRRQRSQLEEDRQRLIDELYRTDVAPTSSSRMYQQPPRATSALGSRIGGADPTLTSPPTEDDSAYEVSVLKVLEGLERTKRQRSKSEGRVREEPPWTPTMSPAEPPPQRGRSVEYQEPTRQYEHRSVAQTLMTNYSHEHQPSSPVKSVPPHPETTNYTGHDQHTHSPTKPVPPQPAPRRRQMDREVTKLPPLVRTKSGNVMNMAGFHSLNRGGQTSTPDSGAASYRVRDADYVSDSEYALNDRSGVNRDSLRRSKKLLEHSAKPQQNSGDHKLSTRLQRASSDCTQSDSEDFITKKVISMERSSTTNIAEQPAPLNRMSVTDRGSNTDFFKDQVAQWRQEFLAATAAELAKPSTPTAPPAPPAVIAKQTYDQGAMTDPAPTCTSVAVSANIEPPSRRSEAQLEIKMVECQRCDVRQKLGSVSVAIGTGPLPPAKPAAACGECSYLRAEIDRLSVKPVRMSQACSTVVGSADVHRWEKAAMTDAPLNVSVGLTADMGPLKPAVATFATNTEPTSKADQFEIGIMTDRMRSANASVNTEAFARTDLVDSAVNTTKVSRSSKGETTDASVTGCSFWLKESADIGSSTDLDLGSLLAQLDLSQQKPTCRTAATSTEHLITSNEKGVSTESRPTVDTSSSTNMVSNRDGSAQTDKEVRATVESRSTASATVKVQSRTQYANTEAVAVLAKATDTGIRVCDAITNTPAPFSTAPAEPLLKQTLYGAQEATAVSTGKPLPIMMTQSCQTDFAPSYHGGRRSEEDESCDELWLMPEQPMLTSIGVGDSRIDQPPSVLNIEIKTPPPPSASLSAGAAPPPCTACVSRTAAFTRHVGVGVCAVTDRICVHCDRLPPTSSASSDVIVGGGDNENEFATACSLPPTDETQAPGFSFETSPAYSNMRLRRERLTSANSSSSVSQQTSPPADPQHQQQHADDDVTSRSNISTIHASPDGRSVVVDTYEKTTAAKPAEVDDNTCRSNFTTTTVVRSGDSQTTATPADAIENSVIDSYAKTATLAAEAIGNNPLGRVVIAEPDYSPAEEDDDEEERTPSPIEEQAPPTPPPKRIDLKKPRVTRAFELSRAAAVKKLLTSESQSAKDRPGSFKRGTPISKSMRVEGKKGDSLAYITDKKAASGASAAKPSVAPPQKKAQSGGLKSKVHIKKEPPPSKVPEPVSAVIPRPKIVKYATPAPARTEMATPEEVAEADDLITPLRSEMVRLRSWPGSPRQMRAKTSQQPPSTQQRGGGASYDNAAMDDDDACSARPADGRLVGGVVSSHSYGSDSDSSGGESGEEGTYELGGADNASAKMALNADSTVGGSQELLAGSEQFVAGVPFKEAAETLNRHLLLTAKGSVSKEDAVDADKLTWSQKYLQHEWLKTAARRQANASHVEAMLATLAAYSPPLLDAVVNMSDQNENTALHYAVSHGNFDVVSLLLDAKVCRLTRPNKAGYTPVMLAALCSAGGDTERTVVKRLFRMGDVNVKASQHGQTALMLAVSHGRTDTAGELIDCGAGLNLQDEDGSTALMCAAEHGHRDIVRLLLAQPDIDASMSDYDGSTALSIAVENGHRDIGVLLYAHLNYGRSAVAKLASPQTTRETPASSTAADATVEQKAGAQRPNGDSIDNSSESVGC